MKTYSVMILKADDSPAEIHHIDGTGGPAFDKIYPLINASMIEIAQGRWVQSDGQAVNVDLFCDEEGLMKEGAQVNHRASHLRWHLFKREYGAQMPDPRVVGDVAVVFPPRIKLDANWTPDFQGQPLVHAEDAEIFAAADKVASIID